MSSKNTIYYGRPRYTLRIHPTQPDAMLYYTASVLSTGENAGFNLIIPKNVTVPARAVSFMIDLEVRCEMIKTTRNIPTSVACMLYPRSSTGSKTAMRMAGSVGVIDKGYRGHICACVDNVSDTPIELKTGESYFQICAPTMKCFDVVVTDTLSESVRGSGGFGSTGK